MSTVTKKQREAERQRSESLLLLGWRIAALYVFVLCGVSAIVSGIRGQIVHTPFPPGVIIFLLSCLVVGGVANVLVSVLVARSPAPTEYLLRPTFMTFMGFGAACFGAGMLAFGALWPPALPIAIAGEALLVIAMLISASRFFRRSA